MMVEMVDRSMVGLLKSWRVLFGPFGWPEIWIFLAVFTVCSLATGIG